MCPRSMITSYSSAFLWIRSQGFQSHDRESTGDEFNSILTVVCRNTKAIRFIPTRDDITATDFAKVFFEHVKCEYGTPILQAYAWAHRIWIWNPDFASLCLSTSDLNMEPRIYKLMLEYIRFEYGIPILQAYAWAHWIWIWNPDFASLCLSTSDLNREPQDWVSPNNKLSEY